MEEIPPNTLPEGTKLGRHKGNLILQRPDWMEDYDWERYCFMLKNGYRRMAMRTLFEAAKKVGREHEHPMPPHPYSPAREVRKIKRQQAALLKRRQKKCDPTT